MAEPEHGDCHAQAQAAPTPPVEKDWIAKATAFARGPGGGAFWRVSGRSPDLPSFTSLRLATCARTAMADGVCLTDCSAIMPSAEDWQSASTKIVQLFFKKKRQDEYDALCRAAFEKSADAVLVLSKTEIVGCNEAAIRLLRCNSKADILSRQPSDLAPETQPDGRRSADVASEQIAIAAKEGHARFEWMHRRLDGSTFPVRITLVPVQVNGQSLILSYRQDISELVTAREDKKLAMARLANDFEVKVGAIVDVVSSAATEMATTAASLTATADQTSPSVPMKMRHRLAGKLDLRARKDHLAHAHAADTDRCRGRRCHERRP